MIQTSNENNNLKKCLTDLKNQFDTQQKQFKLATDENNTLREKNNYTENQYINLQSKLKELSDHLLKNEEHIHLLDTQKSEYSNENKNLEKQVIELKHMLNQKHIEFENQIQKCNEQREKIVKIYHENECLDNKIKNLQDTLSHKEYKFNLCEGKLFDCSNTINNLENKLDEIKNEKLSLELLYNEAITQQDHQILKLEIKENTLVDVQEKLRYEQSESKKQIDHLNEQIKQIPSLNIEKDTLLEETYKLQAC